MLRAMTPSLFKSTQNLDERVNRSAAVMGLSEIAALMVKRGFDDKVPGTIIIYIMDMPPFSEGEFKRVQGRITELNIAIIMPLIRNRRVAIRFFRWFKFISDRDDVDFVVGRFWDAYKEAVSKGQGKLAAEFCMRMYTLILDAIASDKLELISAVKSVLMRVFSDGDLDSEDYQLFFETVLDTKLDILIRESE